jgi:outer membrane protein TolC
VARADQAAALQQVTAGLRSAYVAYDVAQASLVSLQHADEAARANYSQAEARFGAGLGTAVELADAEAIRVDAEIQLAVGRFAVSRARAVIARLAGEDS